MSLRPEVLPGTTVDDRSVGQIDYRLTRNSVLDQFRRGRLSKQDVCDAHPELLRVAKGLGQPISEACPICGAAAVHVTYAFGRHLSPGGQPFADGRELSKLTRRAGEVACYVVEVCPSCSWNHLIRTFVASGRRPARAK